MPRRTPYLTPARPGIPPGIRTLTASGPGRGDGEAERKAFYNGRAWRRLRDAFLAENPLCRPCEEAGRLTPATIAHHVEERLARPDLALSAENLAPYCSPCHTKMHKSKTKRG